MNKALEPYVKLAPFLGIGLVVVAAVIVWTLVATRGSHVELAGSIQKVRTLPLDEQSAAAIIDFRVRNPSDYTFIVRKVEVTMEDPSGKTQEGMVISEGDAKNLFAYYPVLGQKYNDSLLIRARIKPGETVDRMLAVRFEVPEKLVQQRKNLRIRITEVDSPVISEISQGAK
ncbi:MAG: hypothetical protein ACM336_00725 [Acidobacteriota bacterium]